MPITVHFFRDGREVGKAMHDGMAKRFNLESVSGWYDRVLAGEPLRFTGEDDYPVGTWDAFEVRTGRRKVPDPLA